LFAAQESMAVVAVILLVLYYPLRTNVVNVEENGDENILTV
jgi:hypothetical protein